jgi:phytanoyl-CoA hydroxylase
VMRQYLCIHFPHKLSPVMAKYLAHPVMVDVLTGIIGQNVKAMQSMLFIKAAGKPGQAWHQDEDFIPTRDRSLTGGWIALDEATIDNGCLWVLPGSHRSGILWEMRVQNDERFDCTDESTGFPWRDEDAIPVEVPAGAMVFFNGYLLHRSLPNTRASGYRRVLVNHYMSAESLLPWLPSQDGTRMALTDYRDIVMIAGKDPFAYKGIENIAEASVRPDKLGGCIPPEKPDPDSRAALLIDEDDG